MRFLYGSLYMYNNIIHKWNACYHIHACCNMRMQNITYNTVMSLGYTISTDGLTELCQSMCDGTDQDRKRCFPLAKARERGVRWVSPTRYDSGHYDSSSMYRMQYTHIYIHPTPPHDHRCWIDTSNLPVDRRVDLTGQRGVPRHFSLCRANLCSGTLLYVYIVVSYLVFTVPSQPPNTLRAFVGLVLLGLVIKCP